MSKNVNFCTFVRFCTWPIDGFCTFASHFIYSVHRKWRSVIAYIQRVSEMSYLLFQIWHILNSFCGYICFKKNEYRL
jgi:hypothetical protein